MARPNAWKERIEPRISEIMEWATAGATNKEIASALGVSYSSFMKHCSNQKEFSDSLREIRMSGVPIVRSALYKRAIGFEYEEKKTYIKQDEDGNQSKYTEITKKYALPDVSAIQIFLRNNADEFRDKDKQTYDFKEMELELRKMMIDSKEW